MFLRGRGRSRGGGSEGKRKNRVTGRVGKGVGNGVGGEWIKEGRSEATKGVYVETIRRVKMEDKSDAT